MTTPQAPSASSPPPLYFAYGSNMDASRMLGREVPFRVREAARLDGFQLLFNKVASRRPREGYANIVPCTGETVEGILYHLAGKSGLDALDRFEGAPDHYRRIEVEVLTSRGSRVRAAAYQAGREWQRPGLRPSREYMDHLLAGSDLLSPRYVARLRAMPPLWRLTSQPDEVMHNIGGDTKGGKNAQSSLRKVYV